MGALNTNDRDFESPAARPATNIDQLKYLADLALELQHMATQMNLELLAGLLMCAHDEAKRQIKSAS